MDIQDKASSCWIEDDILLVDKPLGITSFDVIRKMRRILGIKKIGHAGTLDPLASGLLILGVQTGTKKMTDYLKKNKTYTATVLLGRQTTTGDTEGEILEQKKVQLSEVATYQKIAEGMVGCFDYQVPLYSAIKVDGKALYKYAREGKTPPRIPVKQMCVDSFEILGAQKAVDDTVSIEIRIAVQSGAYIRTLAESFGEKCGAPAMLTALRRESIDGIDVDRAFILE